MLQSRRSFLRFSLMAAPAIVCAANIMPVRAFIMPEELSTQEMIAILAGRLEEGTFRFDQELGRWVGGKYQDLSPYGRGTYGLERSIQRSHVGLVAQEPKIMPPPDHIWAAWK